MSTSVPHLASVWIDWHSAGSVPLACLQDQKIPLVRGNVGSDDMENRTFILGEIKSEEE